MDKVINLDEWKRKKQEQKEVKEDKQRFTYESNLFFDDDYINEFELITDPDD